MTIKEWCHERQIKESQYYYWLRTLRCKEIEKAKRRQGTFPFVELPAILQGRNQQSHRDAAIIRKGEISIKGDRIGPGRFYNQNPEGYSPRLVMWGCTAGANSP